MIAPYPSLLERYPVAVPAISLAAGILAGAAIEVPSPAWSQAFLLPALGLLLATLRPRWSGFLWVASALLFFALGLHLCTKELRWGDDFQPATSKASVEATVTTLLGSGPDFRILLLDSGTDLSSGKALPGKGRLFLRDDALPLCAGDRISFRSRLRKPANRGNPGEYDWETDCRNNGILWLASVQGKDSVALVRQGSRISPEALLFRLRGAMARFLESHSGRFLDDKDRADVRAIHKGIILGDRGEIRQELNRSFADSGLVHVLSASGVHVGMVVLLTLLLVRILVHIRPEIMLWIPFKKLGALCSIPAIVIYCLLVGARVPAIRSTIMGSVIALAILMDRRWSSFNTLALAAVPILILYPLSILTPEFQLSFAAVAGIFFVVNVVIRRFRATDGEEIPDEGTPFVRRLRGLLRPVLWSLVAVGLTSVAATLAVAPFLFKFFRSFPVYTVFANVLTDFILTAALCLGLTASVSGLVVPAVGQLLLIPADFCVWATIKVSAFFAGLPWSTIRVPNLSLFQLACVTAAALGVLWFMRNPGRVPILLTVASMLALAVYPAASSWTARDRDRLTAMFLNVGKADAAFVKAPGSNGLLIDGGLANSYFDAGRTIVIPVLQWSGAASLDGVIISHPDMDHIGGLLSVIQRVPPSGVWWNPIASQPPHLLKIFQSAAERGIPVLSADSARDPVPLGKATLRFLNGPYKKQVLAHRDVNNSSVVVRVEYGDFSILFTGDLERDGERDLMDSGANLKATVLKVAHHGGKSGTSRWFLEAVRPEIAVISAEYPALQGSPHRETLRRLEDAGVRILWTGRDGAITIVSDGKQINRITTGRRRSLDQAGVPATR